jgi:Protein of unknown function (DUF429)
LGVSVLGVDLSSARWETNGTAILTFTQGPEPTWTQAQAGVVRWPASEPFTPARLSEEIDRVALASGIAAVALDGPQGWRDASAPRTQGVGRACERSSRTPGKTGPRGVTYPRTYLRWVEFSIAVFDTLLALPHVRLANDPDCPPLGLPGDGQYLVAECFPTSTWRASGLVPLPAKRKRPDLALFTKELRRRFWLPATTATANHDDLQALVAALSAAALLGGARAIPHGRPAATDGSGRVEGLIWDAAPLSNSPPIREHGLRGPSAVPRSSAPLH